MNKLILAAILFFTQASYGQVTLLEKGQPSPYKGYLFTPEMELETRVKLSRVNLLESLVIKQQEQVDILKDRIQIKEEQIDNISKQYELANKNSSLNKMIFFTLGFIAMGTISYYVYRK